MVGRLNPDADRSAGSAADRFDELMAAYDPAMLIVTTVTRAGHRSGCLVGFATQCSIDPPRFLVCLSIRNHTFRAAADAEVLAVHLVPPDRDDLAERFGGTTGDEVDTFAGVDWRPGPEGVPLIEGCPDRFVGRIADRLPLGDHLGFLLDVVTASDPGPDPRVTHLHEVVDIRPGHDP